MYMYWWWKAALIIGGFSGVLAFIVLFFSDAAGDPSGSYFMTRKALLDEILFGTVVFVMATLASVCALRMAALLFTG